MTDELTTSALEEFNANPVWRDIRAQLRERRTSLYATILTKYEELPEVVEIKLINMYLSKPVELRDMLKEKGE